MDFSDLRVLCVGDVMLDRFVYGSIERISPEAPVPVVRLNHRREMLGGAGNVANNVSALGGRLVLTGLIGRDDAGQCVQRALAALPFAVANLVETVERPTICKTRYIAGNQQVVRVDEESQLPLTKTEEAGLIAAVLPWVCADRINAIILSDYGKGALSPCLIANVTEAARAAKLPVFVDPKHPDFTRYRGVTCIKPNLKELASASGYTVGSEAEIVRAARSLLAQTGVEAILATRSEKGMILVEASESVHAVPSRAREISDVSGAGDTVIATLALCYAAGRSMPQAMRVANAAAGVVVSKFGTATATTAEVLHELAFDEFSEDIQNTPALMSRDHLQGRVMRWKQQGLSVGFTNGCFDILHSGHVSLLSHARSKCDRLIVALNTDASVSRLKGSSRPINPLELRAKVIGALRDVDCIVAFDQPTPFELIRDIMPDVLFKGADYTADNVVGGDLVRSAGGTVFLLPLLSGQSTTNLIKHMQKAEVS